MPQLPEELFKEVVQFMVPTINLWDPSDRRSYIAIPLQSRPVYANINWQGAATSFTSSLIQLLNHDDLIAVLEYFRTNHSGEEQNRLVNSLCTRIRENYAHVDDAGKPQDPVPPWIDPDEHLIPNLSSTIGSIHVHIDGGGDKQLAKRCAKLIDPDWSRSEIAQVTQFVDGPQRNEMREVYAEHTPTRNQKESLEFLSTTVLHEGDPEPRDGKLAEIEDKVRLVLGGISAELQELQEPQELQELQGMQRNPGGIVVEAERVVGRISENGKACWAEKISLPNAFSPTFTFKKKQAFSSSTLYEVHFGIDILGKSDVDELPIPLSDLVEASAQANIRVGGWFIFWNPNKWAYRSNMFLQHLDQDRIRLNWEQLNEQVRGINGIDPAKVNIRVIVEESLGVWKAPFEKVDPESRTIPELAAWESSLPPGTMFWVVTGNFLGDQHEAVRNAMLNNFGKDIKYIFFLQSFADIARWQHFRYELEKDHKGVGSKMDAFIIEFEHLGIWPEKLDCFIAQRGDNPEGYKLTRDPYNNNIIRGAPLAREKINEINELLQPVMNSDAIVSTLHVVENRPIDGGVIWLDFGYFDIIRQKKPNESDFARFCIDYDGEISADISKCDGEVTRSSELGLVVILANNSRGNDIDIVERTFRLARVMLDLLERKFRSMQIDSTPHRLVLDYGRMLRLVRSSGRAITGDPLRRCRCKAAVLNPGRNVALRGIQTILAKAESPLGILSRINDDEFDIDWSKTD